MNYKRLYLSLDGRITRSDFWLKFYLPYFVLSLVLMFVDLMIFGVDMSATQNSGMSIAGTPPSSPSMALSTLFSIIALWPSIAVTVKRLHDRERSGWFTLMALIPVIGWIYILVDAGMLRGTVGDNRFGADPLNHGITQDGNQRAESKQDDSAQLKDVETGKTDLYKLYKSISYSISGNVVVGIFIIIGWISRPAKMMGLGNYIGGNISMLTGSAKNPFAVMMIKEINWHMLTFFVIGTVVGIIAAIVELRIRKK